jgi:hypothetical protein
VPAKVSLSKCFSALAPQTARRIASSYSLTRTLERNSRQKNASSNLRSFAYFIIQKKKIVGMRMTKTRLLAS